MASTPCLFGLNGIQRVSDRVTLLDIVLDSHGQLDMLVGGATLLNVWELTM